MKKGIVSVIIVLSIVLNIFGFGVLEARASSEAIISTLALAVLSVVAGALTGVAANLSGQVLASIPENVLTNVNNQAIQNGEVILINEFNGSYYFETVSGLDSDTLEFASFLCNYLNNCENIDTILNSYLTSINGGLSASNYAAIKSDAIRAFTGYIEAKQHAVNMENSESAMSELASILGVNWDSDIDFDFVGPITPIQLSDVQSSHSIDIDGVHFFTPILLTYTEANGWPTRATIESLGGDVAYPITESGYYGTKTINPGYGGSCYVIYDNDIYFNYYSAHRSQPYVNETIWITIPGSNNLSDWVNVQGQTLSSKVNSANDVIGSYVGIYAWTSPGNLEKRPILNSLPTNNDFIDTSGGGSISIPRSDAENTVGQAISLGLVSDDPTIELNADGSIASVDGIDLSVLENLVRELIDKTYSFESFEEYLQTITQLLQAGNANTDQIDDVLSALRAWELSQSDALSRINTTINTAASSITEALSISAESEIDLPDIDAEGFIVEHTGFAEANAIVTNLPIVQQISNLFDAVLDPDKYTETAPSFKFYYDSNGDGVQETYTALDLSFLENTLTNNNLEDKNRFQDPMTIREFIQILIISLCYIAFAFKVLRKLPSLLGGSESVASDGMEITYLERTGRL